MTDRIGWMLPESMTGILPVYTTQAGSIGSSAGSALCCVGYCPRTNRGVKLILQETVEEISAISVWSVVHKHNSAKRLHLNHAKEIIENWNNRIGKSRPYTCGRSAKIAAIGIRSGLQPQSRENERVCETVRGRWIHRSRDIDF